jgi:hypothetical protein
MAVLIEIPQREPWRGHFQDFQPHRRGFPPPTAVSQVHIGAVGLIPANKGAVDDQIRMAIVVHVSHGERDANRAKHPRRGESHACMAD